MAHQNIENIREGTVIFRAGQVLTSAVVDENMTEETAAQVLGSVLRDINTALRERLNIQDENAVVINVQRREFEDTVRQITMSPVKSWSASEPPAISSSASRRSWILISMIIFLFTGRGKPFILPTWRSMGRIKSRS